MENSADFADALLREKLVAVVPGEAFGADRCVRLSYAIDDAQIEKAMKRIGEFVKNIL
ncbi:MAG: aminotransferase class I/II-fold pyridoxal phosphate-dependent enzyme, partial [Clostridia bacterium]|nr:aminotransferase class I/II-fold pyridoxal phosphate-dependent enzyme [Clostridia bacterium]